MFKVKKKKKLTKKKPQPYSKTTDFPFALQLLHQERCLSKALSKQTKSVRMNEVCGCRKHL